MFCRKALFLAGLTLCVSFECIGQIVTSAQNGFWHEPSTWTGGVVPSSANCREVRISHPVQIVTSVDAASVDVASTLHVAASGALDIVPPTGGGHIRVQQDGELQIDGTLIGRDSVLYDVAPDQVLFGDGSEFRYLGASRGFIPTASWHANSTFLINGFVGSGYIAIAYSDSWKQTFGNVVYDCPLQTSFVDLNGYLKDIRGSLVIRNTNNQSLRLSTTQRPVIRIGGDFRVEGPSEVWMSTTGDSTRIHVGGDFEYRSTSTGPSYFTTRGRCYVEVAGVFRLDATGPLRICSGSTDSTGIRRTTILLRNGLTVNRGGFIAPFPGNGVLIFGGGQAQEVVTHPAAFSGNMNFHVNTEAIVDLNESEIVTGGSLRVKGHLRVGSLDPDGALQPGEGGGNFQSALAMMFYPGSVLEYNGSGRQFMAALGPSNTAADVIMNNVDGVTLLGDLIARNVTVANGSVDLNEYAARLSGNVISAPGSTLTNGDLVMTGAGDCEIGADATLRDLMIEKNSGTEVEMVRRISVRRNLLIRNVRVTLRTHNNLTLLSSSDAAGATGAVAPIPVGSAIEGDVTVQRFMSGEGRLYRYISSPVEAATVAALKDDFPVTGKFLDPSSGPGIYSSSPSLYYYRGWWQPFPVSGYAAENRLVPGLGYAAFVRGNASPVMLDFTGRLNQGSLDLPAYFDESGDPEHIGWSLVGNPYAAVLDWGASSGWTRSANMSLVFAIRDNGENRFRYSDGEVGDANGGLIASGQAFWVYAASADPALTVHEEAKATSDAAFFRGRDTTPDYIRIALEGTDTRDEAYIRKRIGARPEADPADAVKRWNDRLSLSVLSFDSIPLALYAVDAVSCEAAFRLHMSYPPGQNGIQERIPPGAYALDVEGFGLFSFSQLRIADTFTGDTTDASAYRFDVTDVAGSAAPGRLVLLVTSRFPDSVDLRIESFTCDDSVAVVRLQETDSARGRYLASAGNGPRTFDSEGRATIPTDQLKNGPVEVRITIENSCGEKTLGELTIDPLPVPEAPEIESQTRCGPGPVLFSVANAPAESKWYWYDDPEDTWIFISNTAYFSSPHLSKSKTYYVVAENRFRCHSEMVPVDALIINIDSIQVWEEQSHLHSSVLETEWYYSGLWLHTGPVFLPPGPGRYTARVNSAGCTTETRFDFNPGDELNLYPVPFDDRLTISAKALIERLKIIDARGRVVLETRPRHHFVNLETGNWPPGLYIAQVGLKDRMLIRRVLRR